jgi:hypothetical protein
MWKTRARDVASFAVEDAAVPFGAPVPIEELREDEVARL